MNVKNERPAQSQNEQSPLLVYRESSITFEYVNGNLMINATQVAKPFGKKPISWTKTEQFKDLINAVSKVKKITLADLQVVKQGGNNPGTWFQEDLALLFAQWLSPEFYVLCNEKLKEIVLKENSPRKINETASAYSEETIIIVPMGSTINQIWISEGIVYAKASPMMRYLGYDTGITPKYVEKIGEHHFRKVLCVKQECWFVSIEGFEKIISHAKITVSNAKLSDIFNDVYGIERTNKSTPYTYRFTDSEMLDILSELHKKPVGKDIVARMLFKGKK
jgi:hypothetical protein